MDAGNKDAAVPHRLHSRLAPALIVAVACCALATPAAAHHVKERKSYHRVDGERVPIVTHGDPKSAFKRVERFASSRSLAAPGIQALPSTWDGCGSERSTDNTANQLSNAPQIKVIYAYPNDKSSRFNTDDDLIQADIKAIFEKVAAESGNTRSLRFDLGTEGPAGCVDIISLQLPNQQTYYTGAPSEEEQQDRTFDDLRTVIPNLAGVHNYIAYVDYVDSPGTAGVGELVTDDSFAASNQSNLGELIAILWGDAGGGFASQPDAVRRDAALHEITHNLGAVQDSAPNSTNAGHCFDGDLAEDVMCYDDGGDGVPGALTHPCDLSSSPEYDCNNDDYFSASPAAGSYLATKWNTYNSYFTCAVAKCETALTSPTVSSLNASDGSPVTFQSITFTASASDTDGTIARYEWDFNGNGTFDRTTTTASTTTSFTSPGTRTVKVRVSDNDQAFDEGTKTVTVATNQPPNPDFNIVPFPFTAGQVVTLDASGSSDPDDGIASYAWDIDGLPGFELSGKTIQAAFPAGVATVSVRVTDKGGNQSISSATFTVPAAGAAGSGGTSGTTLGPSAFNELVVKTKYKLKKTLKKGLDITTDVSVAGSTVDATLYAPSSKLKASSAALKKVGHKTKVATAAGELKLRIKFTKKARKRLKRFKKLKLTLVLVVTAPGRTPGGVVTKVLLKK